MEWKEVKRFLHLHSSHAKEDEKRAKQAQQKKMHREIEKKEIELKGRRNKAFSTIENRTSSTQKSYG